MVLLKKNSAHPPPPHPYPPSPPLPPPPTEGGGEGRGPCLNSKASIVVLFPFAVAVVALLQSSGGASPLDFTIITVKYYQEIYWQCQPCSTIISFEEYTVLFVQIALQGVFGYAIYLNIANVLFLLTLEDKTNTVVESVQTVLKYILIKKKCAE